MHLAPTSLRRHRLFLAISLALLQHGASAEPIDWLFNTDGLWTDARQWSSHPALPAATDDVTINVAGAPYQVTLDAPTTVNTLLLGLNATLFNTSSLTTHAGITLNGGSLDGGVYRSATAAAPVVRVASDQRFGTLHGVSLQGRLDLDSGSLLEFSDGLVVKDTNGTGAGEIRVTGGAYLVSMASQTLDHATLRLGSDTGWINLVAYSGVLTLGPNLLLQAAGDSNSYGFLNGDQIVNQGTLAFSNGGSNNTIAPTRFSNEGAIILRAGSSLDLSGTTVTNSAGATVNGDDGSKLRFVPNGSFTNFGTLTMNGNRLATVLQLGLASNPGLDPDYHWTNSGTINVTNTDLRLGGYFTVADLGLIHRNGGAVSLNGFLDNTGTVVDVDSGVLADALSMRGGTIHGGIVQGTLTLHENFESGTLDGVTVQGDLDITGARYQLKFRDGLVVKDAAGTGPGQIHIAGPDAALISLESQTLDDMTVHLGDGAGTGFLAAQSGVLTLGANLHVLADGRGGAGLFYGEQIINQGTLTFTSHADNSIVSSGFTNESTITVASASFLNLQGMTATNAAGGVITGDNGAYIQLGPGGEFTNFGTLTMNGAGARTVLQLGFANQSGIRPDYRWHNRGTINLTATELRLGGSFATADLGVIHRHGGTVSLNGMLDNSGAVLNVATGQLAGGLSMQGGTLHGGTVLGALMLSEDASAGILEGVTLHGELDLTGAESKLQFSAGLVVTDTSGAGPGQIQVTGINARLASAQTQTLDNLTVHLGGGSGAGFLASLDGTLTLGSTLQVLADGDADSYGFLYGAGLFNRGRIAFSNGNQNNAIAVNDFSNEGVVSVANGASLSLSPDRFSNFVAGRLSGGSYRVFANSTLRVTNAPIERLDADIVLSGAAAAWRSIATATGDSTDIEASLRSIEANGALHLLAGRDYASTQSLTNHGRLEFGGGSLSAVALSNTARAEMFGFGEITARVLNSGSIRAAGGRLVMAGGVDGEGGRLQSDRGAELVLARDSHSDLLINNGSLALGRANVTVAQDYNNASFASGNRFNARAAVSGSGRILAAGDVAQALSGQVSDGSGSRPDMNFGNIHVGDVVVKNFAVTNRGSRGPRLRGALQTAAGGGNISDPRLSGSGVTAGQFAPLATGRSSAPYAVAFSGKSAGALSGQRVAVVNNFDNVAEQVLAIDGAVYRYAVPGELQPIDFGAHRVGEAMTTREVSIRNIARNDGYSEALRASIAALDLGFTASGAGQLIGAEGVGGVKFGLDTGSAGVKTGQASLIYVSDGEGSSGLGQTPLGTDHVSLTGRVYARAVAALDTTQLNFGIVHVGDVIDTQAFTLRNLASGTLTDNLRASISATPPGFMASGSLDAEGIAQGATSSALGIALDTTAAGMLSGDATLTFASHNAELTDVTLGAQSVALSAQVNHFAVPVLSNSGDTGSFTEIAARQFVFDFGTVTVGAARLSGLLQLSNLVSGPADELGASFAVAGGPFTLAGFSAVSGLAAGQSHALHVAIQPSTAGLFEQQVAINLFGENASGFHGEVASFDLRLRIYVQPSAVPLPPAMGLFGAAMMAMAGVRRRRSS